ncbi:MAG: arginine repressor [Prolixibacteraceae bacterium]|nr:arginine repressor [Prolixibacteraceae bacterium]
MKNRVKRQLEIRKIILNGNVRSQEELLDVLKMKGVDITQATLSRDLKALQVAKIPHPTKGYVYSISEAGGDESGMQQSHVNYLTDGFRSLQFSGSLAVIKTMPGYASSIAAVIDSAKKWEIIGTIAGDDTILLVQREGILKTDLQNALVTIMPNLKGKI